MQFTYGNGIVHTMVQNARQLPASSTDTGGALSQQFVYDRNGNVTGVTDALDSARSKTMSYDALDRLTSATSTSFGGSGTHAFAYDPIDNLRSWTLGGVKDLADYVYSAQNRLVEVRNSAGSVVHQFAYDPQGNITSRNTVPHDFDYGNRLRAVPGIEAYRYDGSGRRVQSTKANGSTTLWMYSQGGQMLFSSKLPAGGEQTTHENVYLAGSLVATIDHAWPSNAIIATKYQHTDALGSPVAVTNEAGAVIERTNFDPYGGAIGKVVDGLGYTGHVMDPLTGLTYMQQRYYDQGVGRFLSVDPVTASSVNGGNFNRYWYANNNPYRFIDPDGRLAMTRHKGFCEMVNVCIRDSHRVISGGSRRIQQEADADTRSDVTTSTRQWQRRMKTSEADGIRTIEVSITMSPGPGVTAAETEAYIAVARAGWSVSINGKDGIVKNFIFNLTFASKRGDTSLNLCTVEICKTGRSASEINGRRHFLGISRHDTPTHEFGHTFGIVNNRADGTGSIMSGDEVRSVTEGDFDLLWKEYHEE